jgi:hypothetical protein
VPPYSNAPGNITHSTSVHPLMKRALFTILVLSGIIQARSQTQFKSFSPDTGIFIKELGQFMKEGQNTEQSEKAYKSFLAEWNRPVLTESERRAIIRICNKMLIEHMRANSEFILLLKALTAFSAGNRDEILFANWQKITEKTLTDNKRAFKEFIEFSGNLFEDNTIYKTPQRTWKCTSSDYTLGFDIEPFITFKQTDLTSNANGNTSTIYNTMGVYYPSSKVWRGKGGKVTWERVHIDQSKAWADISTYAINTDKNEYSIDSVRVTNKMYNVKDLPGKFTDKLIAVNESAFDNYPKFISYSMDVHIADFGKGIKYHGGFGMYGNQIIGTGTVENRASFSFFYKDTLRCKLESTEFYISEENIGTGKAKYRFYVKKDSIFHPKVKLTYNRGERKMVIYRGTEGVESGPFIDTYHKLEVFVDEIHWYIDRPNVDFKMATKDQAARFESMKFYNEVRYEKLQGPLDINPLNRVVDFCRKHRTQDFTLQEYADFLGTKEEYVLPFILIMSDNGLCDYDIETKKIHVYFKAFDYVNAHNNIADFDIIRMESIIGARPNASMNLINYDMDLQGVPRINFSDSQNVYVYLKDQVVSISDSLDMHFSGHTHAGRFDFYGAGFSFDYNAFKIRMNNVDSMKFLYPTGEKDVEGKDLFVRVNTVLQNIYGTLYIDSSTNKSGRINYPQFPIFVSDKGSNVFYDYPTTQSGLYKRDRFFFSVDPFTIDSLDNFTKEGLSFEGDFHSDGIVPEFHDKLTLQEDFSLGFKRPTPAGGYPLYKGKGKGEFMMSLSNKGFFGTGSIDYLTTHLTSKEFLFLLDSMNTTADNVVVTKSSLFPSAKTTGAYVSWRAYKDTMAIYNKAEPFAMYDNQAQHKGNLLITPQGMGGAGTIAFNEAEISSADFKFNNHTFNADIANFILKSVDSTKYAFHATNVKAFADFEKRYADFKSNEKGTEVDLPFNMYRSTLADMTWKIDEQKVILTKGKSQDENSSLFISTMHSQEDLNFISTNAVFDLKSYILTCNKVPYIKVADSKVIPDSGRVVITENAHMNTLYNAVVKTDTINNYHKIYNATINVLGRRALSGNGYYDFVDRRKNKKVIYFNAIGVNNEKQVVASAAISDTSDFELSKHFDFKGNALLTSVKKDLTFDGYILTVHEMHPPRSTWFRYNDRISADSVILKIDDPIDVDKNPLAVGFNVAHDSTGMYASFFSRRHSYSDDMLLVASNGKCVYDNDTGAFKCGDEKKIMGKSYQGSMVTFDEDQQRIIGEGKINFNANGENFKIKSGGIITNYLFDSSYTLDVVMLLDFLLPQKALKIMADTIYSTSRELEDVDNQRYAAKVGVGELADEKNYKQVIKRMEEANAITQVPEFNKTLMFNDLKMAWNRQARSFIGSGALGIYTIGNKLIDKRMFGKVQISKKRAGEVTRIYFETNAETWFYFSFQGKTLSVVSSDENFNKLIKENMEKMSDDDYRLVPATLREKTMFIKNLDY